MDNLTYKRALILGVSTIVLGITTPFSDVRAQNQSTTTFNYESSQLPYNWHTTSWGQCSGECNNGSQSRTVSCSDNAGNVAPSENDCSHSAKPDTSRSCDLADCQWILGTCPSHVHTSGGSSSSGGSDGCCFVAGTQIRMIDGSTKNIEDIVVGDKVRGFNGAEHTVTDFTETTLADRSLISINGGKFFASFDHVFKSKDGWVSVRPDVTAIYYQDVIDHIGGLPDETKVGTVLVGEEGDVEITTLDLKEASPDLPLYDFNVDGDHTYIADGYVVHNGGHGSGGSCC